MLNVIIFEILVKEEILLQGQENLTHLEKEFEDYRTLYPLSEI
jgi:hypothetical protein